MLMVVDNEEVYEREKPLSLKDLRCLIIILKQALWQLLWLNPESPLNLARSAVDSLVLKRSPLEYLQYRVSIVAPELLSQVGGSSRSNVQCKAVKKSRAGRAYIPSALATSPFVSDCTKEIPSRPMNCLLMDKQRRPFYIWYYSATSNFVRGISTNMERSFFKTILDESGWLESTHIGEALCHIYKAITDYPAPFARVAVMDECWTQFMNEKVYYNFGVAKRESSIGAYNGDYVFDSRLVESISGKWPRMYGKSMADVDRIYAIHNVNGAHWIALEINFRSMYMILMTRVRLPI